jgi:2-methylcitrate dehydratase PrpD
MVGALGLAGVQGAGLMEVFHDGAMAKPFQTARASSAGLLAVELAARGASGPSSILEGEQGFIAALCGGEARLERLTDGLGQDWRILGAYFKEHAACRHSHAAIDGSARLRADGLRPEDVESVLVRTYKVAYRLCADDGKPKGISEAKFSLPYTVALALTHGHGRQSGFSLERIADPELLALAARVRVEVDPEIEKLYPERRAAILEVRTRDGRLLMEDVPIARGEPEIPLSDAEIEGKFLDNASAVFPVERARAIVEAVRTLDSRESIAPLMDLVSGR